MHGWLARQQLSLLQWASRGSICTSFQYLSQMTCPGTSPDSDLMLPWIHQCLDSKYECLLPHSLLRLKHAIATLYLPLLAHYLTSSYHGTSPYIGFQMPWQSTNCLEWPVSSLQDILSTPSLSLCELEVSSGAILQCLLYRKYITHNWLTLLIVSWHELPSLMNVVYHINRSWGISYCIHCISLPHTAYKNDLQAQNRSWLCPVFPQIEPQPLHLPEQHSSYSLMVSQQLVNVPCPLKCSFHVAVSPEFPVNYFSLSNASWIHQQQTLILALLQIHVLQLRLSDLLQASVCTLLIDEQKVIGLHGV